MAKTPEEKKSTKFKEGQFIVAIIIIVASFGIIAGMLWIHIQTTADESKTLQLLVSNPRYNDTQVKTMIDTYAKVDQSDQTVFNIMLPVFGAWVGAVVAFYFGSKNLQAAHETIDKVLDTKKLDDMSIEELIKKYHPDAKKVVTVMLTDTLIDVKKKIKDFYNVVVIDQSGKPLGIIYGSDLPDPDRQNPNQRLVDVLGQIQDPITGKPWTPAGVNNFAKIRPQDTVSQAKQAMDAIKAHDPKIRGIVLDGDKIEAIVNYQMLTEPLSNL